MEVKVYSTPTCTYCYALKSFLNEKNIDFKDIDIAADAEKQEEIVKKTGQMEVPVIEINGEFIVGFNKEKIKGLLNIKD
jgi:glutaredoxin-like YruB-family protein